MATQAPEKKKTRGTTPEPKAAPAQANGNGSGQTATETKTQEPKTYVFGGSVEAPQPGANSRRLWRFLTANLSDAQIKKVKAELKKIQPADDRFVRWQRIVSACKTVGIEKIKVGDTERTVGQALVRSLQQEDKGGEIGRDAKIVIF